MRMFLLNAKGAFQTQNFHIYLRPEPVPYAPLGGLASVVIGTTFHISSSVGSTDFHGMIDCGARFEVQ